MSFQAYAELSSAAPDGHTRWHSMTDIQPTCETALVRATEYLAGRLVYDHSGAFIVCHVGVVETDKALACALDDLPAGSMIHVVRVRPDKKEGR